MLEQLRNERYRQTAQGLQQGITGALQAYMNMEQLKQAAAEKEAARKERARQFNITEQRLKAIQEGQLGVQQGGLAVRQSEADRLVAKQKAERADVLRDQILQDLRQTAKGIPKGEGALAGVDTQTAKEFMEAGLPGFGKRRQALPAMQTLPQMQGEMPMRVRDAETPPATAQQIFAATPEGGTEQEKTARLMNALIGGMDSQSIRTAAPQEDVVGASISPEAKALGPRDVSRSTGEMELLFKNLEELAAEQEARPESFALTETARKIGYKGPYKQARGLYAEEEERREERDLDLSRRRQDIASGKALETKRLRGRGVGRGGTAKTPKAPFAQIEQSYRSQLNNLTKAYLQGKEGLQKQIAELESAKKNQYGDRTPATAEEKAQAEVLRQQLAAITAGYEENKTVLLARYEETMNRAIAGEPELYRQAQPEQAAAQPTDVAVPEMLARPDGQSVELSPEDREMQQTKEARSKQLEAEVARLTALLGKQAGDVRGTKEFMDLERASDELQTLKDPSHVPQQERRQYEAQAQAARQKYVDVTPQELEQRLEKAPVAARNRYKQIMARMRRAGLSDADIAAAIGLELSQQIPLTRNRI
jgi:hypothetical protein